MDYIVIVSTVRAPLPQIQKFANYHLNIGVDQIILFFDDPDDKAIEVLSKYKRVKTVPCTPSYWCKTTGDKPALLSDRQIANVNSAAMLLSHTGSHWLIHIDSDELINPRQSLKKILTASNADAVRFTLLEAVSENTQYDDIFLPTLFRKNVNKNRIRLAKAFGCSNAIFDGDYLRGHTASKMAMRVSGRIAKYGIHGPRNCAELEVETSKIIELLHYDCVNLQSWRLKWDRRIDGGYNEAAMRRNRAEQMKLYAAAKMTGEGTQLELFSKMHMITKRERPILCLLGMLQVVKIDHHLFNFPSP